MVTSLLTKEQPGTYSRTLAVVLGSLDKAVLLQQMQYWLDINEKAGKVSNHRDGRWWTYNTYQQWHEVDFPFWSVRKIRRLVNELEDQRILISCQPWLASGNATKSYTIDYEELKKLENSTSTHVAKKRTCLSKNDTHVAKNGASIYRTEISTETSPEISKSRTAFSGQNAASTPSEKKATQEERPESSNEPLAKPQKRSLFDGSQELTTGADGWIKLPATLDTERAHRERVSHTKAQAMRDVASWLAEAYPDELEIEIEDESEFEWPTVSGKGFDDEPWLTFTGPDSSMPVRMMREILIKQGAITQDEFNQELSDLFWENWSRFQL